MLLSKNNIIASSIITTRITNVMHSIDKVKKFKKVSIVKKIN